MLPCHRSERFPNLGTLDDAGGIVILSVRRVNCAESLDCEVGLFPSSRLCYSPSCFVTGSIGLAFSSLAPANASDGEAGRSASATHYILVCPFKYGPVRSGSGGILHAQGSAALGYFLFLGLAGRLRGAGAHRCVSVRAARVSGTLRRRFADVCSAHDVRSTTHGAPRADICAAPTACWNGTGATQCSSRGARHRATNCGAGSAETNHPRPGSRGAETGPTAHVGLAVAGETGRGRPARRQHNRLDGGPCPHQGSGHCQLANRFAAGWPLAFHLLGAVRSSRPDTSHRVRGRFGG